jgi:hypothetical protein
MELLSIPYATQSLGVPESSKLVNACPQADTILLGAVVLTLQGVVCHGATTVRRIRFSG